MPASPAAGLSQKDGARNLERSKFSFFAFQAADFPRNRRRNLWKSLEKRAANLEMFGVDLEKLAGPEVRRGERRILGDSAETRPAPHPASPREGAGRGEEKRRAPLSPLAGRGRVRGRGIGRRPCRMAQVMTFEPLIALASETELAPRRNARRYSPSASRTEAGHCAASIPCVANSATARRSMPKATQAVWAGAPPLERIPQAWPKWSR